MDVITAEGAGPCPGVLQSVAKVEKALAEHGEVFYINPVVHNRSTLARLETLGYGKYDPRSSGEDVKVFFRSAHGAPPEESEAVRKNGYQIIDGTCPNVRSVQQQIASQSFFHEQVIIVGKKDHPEVKGFLGNIRNPLCERVVIEPDNPGPGLSLVCDGRIAVFSQTTIGRAKYEKMLEMIKSINPKASVFDSLCRAIEAKVKANLALAQKVSCIIVVGSPESNNTRELSLMLSESCPRVIMVDNVAELDKHSFEGIKLVGLTAGASAPLELIKAVEERLKEL